MTPPFRAMHLPGEGGNGAFDNMVDGCPIPSCKLPSKLDGAIDEIHINAVSLKETSERIAGQVILFGEQLKHFAVSNERGNERLNITLNHVDLLLKAVNILIEEVRKNNTADRKGGPQ